MAYTPTSEPSPEYFENAYSLSQSRLDAWNRIAELTASVSDAAGPARERGMQELAGAFAFLRGIEALWVFPGAANLEHLEQLAVLGHWGELSQTARNMGWHLGLYGEGAALVYPGGVAARDRGERAQHFTALLVSDVETPVLEAAIKDLNTYRQPFDTLVYDVVGARSFDAALACVLLNAEVQAVVVRPDVPLRSGAVFGMFDAMLDELDATYGISSAGRRDRARALADALRFVRPDVDLYLITDEALPDARDPSVMAYDRAFYRYESRSELHMTLLEGVRRRRDTPFFDALKRYAEKPVGNFHALPIARGNSVFDSPWMRDMVDFYGRNIFLAETSTTSGGLDSLLAPTGSLKEAQSKAAKTFGADQTFFVTNGTSTSNKIVVQGLVRPGDIVLIDRNCHKSHHYGLILAGANPAYLDAYKLPQYAMYGAVPIRTIKETLLQLKKAGRLDAVRMLLLTNCTFDGITYDPMRVMMEVLAIKPDMVFLWDEAWFAFAVSSYFARPRTAMNSASRLREMLVSPAYLQQYEMHQAHWGQLDPDDDATWLDHRLMPDPQAARVRVYATQSTHKSLSSLRQGSMIHVHDIDFSRDAEQEFHEAFLTHTSTSPNYQILASLDLARRQVDLEGYRLVERAYEVALVLRRRVVVDPLLNKYFRILQPRDMIPEEFRPSGFTRLSGFEGEQVEAMTLARQAYRGDEFVLEPTRVTLHIAATGMSGDMFKNSILMDRFGLQVNKTSINSVLFIVTIGATWGALSYLLEALTDVARTLELERQQASRPQRAVFKRNVRGLSSDLPPLPDFSRFHPRFQAHPNSPEGDMRAAYFHGYIADNVEYVTFSEAQALLAAGRELVATSLVVPYPPGFPVLVPGQVLDQAILDFLIRVEDGEIHGYDPELGMTVFTAESLA